MEISNLWINFVQIYSLICEYLGKWECFHSPSSSLSHSNIYMLIITLMPAGINCVVRIMQAKLAHQLAPAQGAFSLSFIFFIFFSHFRKATYILTIRGDGTCILYAWCKPYLTITRITDLVREANVTWNCISFNTANKVCALVSHFQSLLVTFIWLQKLVSHQLYDWHQKTPLQEKTSKLRILLSNNLKNIFNFSFSVNNHI